MVILLGPAIGVGKWNNLHASPSAQAIFVTALDSRTAGF